VSVTLLCVTTPPEPPTLASYPRHNSLNALRLVLATLVIVSHSWPVGGFGSDPRLGVLTLGEVAVAGFFGISGWLITASRMTSTLRGFAWRRFLRIYPGYLGALVAVAFGFAPLAALLSTGTWSPADGMQHVLANLTLEVRDHRVGASLPAGSYPAWNGSLWTLSSEALCYVVVGLTVTVVGRRAAPVAVLALFVVTACARAADVSVPGGSLGWAFVQLSPWFFAGASLFVLRRVVPLDGIAAAAAGVGTVVGLAVEPVLAAVPLAYLALWLGARLPLREVARTTDLSYGMYIYAFPVQQLLVVLGTTQLGVGAYVLLSVLGTVPFAVASWLLIEQPAMRARRWVGSAPGGPRPPGGRHRRHDTRTLSTTGGAADRGVVGDLAPTPAQANALNAFTDRSAGRSARTTSRSARTA
jgi:peptidoglycan/LPS O-acetylase OafA/YrhL